MKEMDIAEIVKNEVKCKDMVILISRLLSREQDYLRKLIGK
jgi:hypothetical protein